MFDAGFVDDDGEETESNLLILDTKTLCELPGVDKSTVSCARNDSDNLLLSVDYSPARDGTCCLPKATWSEMWCEGQTQLLLSLCGRISQYEQ